MIIVSKITNKSFVEDKGSTYGLSIANKTLERIITKRIRYSNLLLDETKKHFFRKIFVVANINKETPI